MIGSYGVTNQGLRWLGGREETPGPAVNHTAFQQDQGFRGGAVSGGQRSTRARPDVSKRVGFQVSI